MIKDGKIIGEPEVDFKETWTNIQAISNPVEGMRAWDTTNKRIVTYNGSIWKPPASAFTDLSDTFTYTGLADKYVKVNHTETGLETGTPAGGPGGSVPPGLKIIMNRSFS